MTHPPKTRAGDIRERLDHPVIDGDGHFLEVGPVLLDYVRSVAGGDAAAQLDERTGIPVESLHRTHRAGSTARPAAAPARRAARPWWVEPANALDWATASSAELLYRRLDELGLDFVVLFPTTGIALLHAWTDEVRQIGCRAFNRYVADRFSAYADRMAPVAAVPMNTPGEALAELEHIGSLGLKAALIPSYVRRPTARITERCPERERDFVWLDSFGIDSAHDYDSVWAHCAARQLPVLAHSQAMGWPDRCSPSNFSFNHMGHFAASGELLCKSLFLGGVTRRFAALRFGVLEGGVSTGCRVFADLVSHWHKRDEPGLSGLDPRRLDVEEIAGLLERWGDERTRDRLADIRELLEMRRTVEAAGDDFARAEIREEQDIRRLFADRFFFGAEADDPLTPLPFRDDWHPNGAQLRAFFGSDIGHWDVRDFTEPLVEAREQVETGRLTEPEFRDFVFSNSARLYGSNPTFFQGTVLEDDVVRSTVCCTPGR